MQEQVRNSGLLLGHVQTHAKNSPLVLTEYHCYVTQTSVSVNWITRPVVQVNIPFYWKCPAS